VTYTTEDGQDIDILQDKLKEAEDGMVYAVNSAFFEMREPEPEPPKTILYRIKYFIANKLIDLAQRINYDSFYDRT